MEDTESCSSRASESVPIRKRRQKVEVYHEIVRRLRDSDNEEASQPGFEDELWAHFNRLPIRYATDVNVERPEDVLMHKRLLHLAYDPTTRPAFEVRLGQVHAVSDATSSDSVHSNFIRKVDAQISDSPGRHSFHPPFAFGLSPNLELAFEANKSNGQVGDDGNLHFFRHLYEITISTIDKPKLLSQMASESTRKDPAWKYAHQLDPKNPNQFKCNFCGKVSNGGVYRVKQHLVGGSRNVTVCQKCPPDVREEIKEYMGNKKIQKDQMNLLPHFDEMNNDFEEDEDDIAYEIQRPRGSSGKALPSNQNSSFAGSKRLKKKGPMDVFYTPNPDFVVQNRKGKQTTIDHNDPYKKELRDRAVIRITRWMYDAGIAFNAVSYDSFGPMVEAIGQYGPGMKPPSFHEVRVPYLKKELNHTNELMRIHKEEWVKYGCSLMSDGWTSQNGRTLINFLVNCPRGTMFVESIDASSYSKDGQKLFELLDKFVDDVGEVNVVQIITDSASANVLAGKFLEAKRPHLFWTPCAAHCLDLILEDIFKLPHMKKTFDRAIQVHGYIYNRPGVLNMMRMFTQLKNLVKPAKTRFATAFLTLSKIHQQKNNLRKMFTSEEWTSSKWAKEPKGKQATQIMLMPSFWNLAVYALKVSGPLVHVLRLVDSEKKPAMGYIYEAMDRAEESIAKSFNENEEKYKNIFEIIDNRWNIQLHQPLHAAGHFLNPEFFYSNPSIEHDPEIMTGLYKCVSRLVRGTDIQDKITQEMSIYTKSEGLFAMPLAIRQRMTRAPVAEFCGNVELCRLTEQVVFSDPYKVSPHNRWTSPYLDRDVEAVCEDNTLKLEVAELKSMFCERAQALIHGDLHTGSVMVTSDSTQVIDPEFAFYGPMGFDIGAFVGNLILAFFAQDGHADQENDRKAYKDWILRTIDETWNLFHKKFTALWDKHKDGSGEAYLPAIYNDPQLQLLVKQKFMKDLFHDTLGFGAAKMIRRIVGVAHVEDFESITDAGKRADCERRALDFAKMLMKERRKFQGIAEVVSAIHELHS